jgi:hypothetical protein
MARHLQLEDNGPVAGTTHFITLINASGSMKPYQQQVVAGYNNLVRALRSSIRPRMDLRVSLGLLSGIWKAADESITMHKEIYSNNGIGSLLEILDSELQASGTAHLYDALFSYLTTLTIPMHEAVCVNLVLSGPDTASMKTYRDLQPVVAKLNEAGNLTLTALFCDCGSWAETVITALQLAPGNSMCVDFESGADCSMLANGAMGYLSKRASGVMLVDDFYGGLSDG